MCLFSVADVALTEGYTVRYEKGEEKIWRMAASYSS